MIIFSYFLFLFLLLDRMMTNATNKLARRHVWIGPRQTKMFCHKSISQCSFVERMKCYAWPMVKNRHRKMRNCDILWWCGKYWSLRFSYFIFFLILLISITMANVNMPLTNWTRFIHEFNVTKIDKFVTLILWIIMWYFGYLPSVYILRSIVTFANSDAIHKSSRNSWFYFRINIWHLLHTQTKMVTFANRP